MRRWQRIVMLAVVILAGAVPAAAQDRISVGYLVGSSAVPVKVIQELGLAKKHGLELEAVEFVDISPLDRAFALGQYDVISALSLNTFGNYLNQGHDLVAVLSTLNPNGSIVVPKSSPYQSLADLKGKRIGVYGINASSTAIFGVIARERYGLDVRKDLQLFGSVPPTLPTLLAKGEVDAILNLPPFVPRMVASGDYRIIMTPSEEWQKMRGTSLPFAFMIASRKTVEAKRPAVRKLVAAWREAVEHLRKHPEVLNAFLASAKITDPAHLKIAHQIMVPHFTNDLTDKDIDNVRFYWESAVKYGFMPKAVQGNNWYTFEFVR